ncbi:protein LOL2-like isoform X1 [Tasmannia lanceolata]|uniref:protein LOL2-like isoform X1 n=1 Tax=Tasmannia lanceolata TaxID=3420 RepID=UPI0040634D51
MQSQLVCGGCRNLLLFPSGAANVRCAICSTITSVPPEVSSATAELVCGGCRTLLMYTRGATTVRCSCCHTINFACAAHVNCGQCQTTLMYPYGAQSVKCAVCHYVTNVGMSNMRVPIPVQRPNGASPTLIASAPPLPHASSQTVVVENPMTVDESGKLVSNVVVGVTTAKK